MASSTHTHTHTSCLLATYHLLLSHGREDIVDIQHFPGGSFVSSNKSRIFVSLSKYYTELPVTPATHHPPTLHPVHLIPPCSPSTTQSSSLRSFLSLFIKLIIKMFSKHIHGFTQAGGFYYI